MDSPLMPTLHRHVDSETSNLLADMSLSSPPSSPSMSFTAPASSSSKSYERSTSPSSKNSTHNSQEHSRPDHQASFDPTPQKEKRPTKPRFSLFAPSQSGTSLINNGSASKQTNQVGSSRIGSTGSSIDEGGEEGLEEEDDNATIHGGSTAGTSQPQKLVSSAERDERLRESLYELRHMNEVFDGFLGALEDARGHNERLATRVSQTSALLDQYTLLLGQTEHTQQLLLNPRWTGAEDDALAIAAEEDARQAAEQQAIEAEREKERIRLEEKERREREAALSSEGRATPRGGSRGGARGLRGGSRGLGRGTGIPRPSGVGGNVKTPGGSGTGTGRRVVSGSGGKYADVKSSGYGPTPAPRRAV